MSTVIPKLQKLLIVAAETAAIAFLAISQSSIVNAATIGFVNNPGYNSTSWTSTVNSLGGVINKNLNFETHLTGYLISDFYSLSDGVTLTALGDVNTVQFGYGAASGNTFTGHDSQGEGLHPPSRYLSDSLNVSKLTISFDQPVLAVGGFLIDYFNPYGNNPYTIEAFTGINGTGTSLGKFSAVSLNFQLNYMYFMGIVSTNENISSVAFTDASNVGSDGVGIDNIMFARTRSSTSIPEPTAVVSTLAFGSLSVFFHRQRKRK